MTLNETMPSVKDDNSPNKIKEEIDLLNLTDMESTETRDMLVNEDKINPSKIPHTFVKILGPLTDAEFNQKLLALQWIEPQDLGIRSEWMREESFKEALNHLNKFAKWRSPRDKIVTVVNCSMLLSCMLSMAVTLEHPPGADGFFPTYI